MCLLKISGIGHNRMFFHCCGLACEWPAWPKDFRHLCILSPLGVCKWFAILFWFNVDREHSAPRCSPNWMIWTYPVAQVIKDFDLHDRIKYDTSESQWQKGERNWPVVNAEAVNIYSYPPSGEGGAANVLRWDWDDWELCKWPKHLCHWLHTWYLSILIHRHIF